MAAGFPLDLDIVLLNIFNPSCLASTEVLGLLVEGEVLMITMYGNGLFGSKNIGSEGL